MVNKVFLVGHLGGDPEHRTFPDSGGGDGGQVATASLATNERWRDRYTNEPREATEWHRLVFHARQAEIAAQYLRRGSRIFVEGQLRTRKWQDKNGLERYTTEVHVRQMQMLDRKPDNQPRAPSSRRNAYADAKEGRTPAPATPAPGANVGVVPPPMPESTPYAYQMPPDADDIPF